jgi:hypothetical protein
MHKEFEPEGKIVNTGIYKGVMDRLLKHIQRVRPAESDFEIFFFFSIKRPPTELRLFASFLPQKMLQPFNNPSTLQIFLRQTTFFSPG